MSLSLHTLSPITEEDAASAISSFSPPPGQPVRVDAPQANMDDDDKEDDSTPSLTPSLSSHVQSIVSEHLSCQRTTSLLATTVNDYLTLSKQHAKAETSLEKFTTKCNSSNGRITLPVSCGIQWNKIIWPTTDDPAFCSEEKAEMMRIENDTNAKIVAQLTSAKKKYVDHLHTRLEFDSYVAAGVTSYSAELNKHLKSTLTNRHLPLPSDDLTSNIRKQAEDNYRRALHDQLSKLTTKISTLNQQRKDAAEALRLQNEQAKDTAMNGISTGQTISNLADRSARNAVAPLQSIIAHEQQLGHKTRKQLTNLHKHVKQIAASASASSLKPRSKQRHKRERSPRHRNPILDNEYDDDDDAIDIDTAFPGTTSYPSSHPPQRKHYKSTDYPFDQGGQQYRIQNFNQPAVIPQIYPLYLPQQQPFPFRPHRRN